MSALVATLLKSRGLDVTTVPEQSTLGKTDSEQLEIASSLSRCLVTHNRVDFEVRPRVDERRKGTRTFRDCIFNISMRINNILELLLFPKKMPMK